MSSGPPTAMISALIHARLPRGVALITPVLKLLPKYVFAFLLLANAGSFPFAWHVRVFWPLIKIRVYFFLIRLGMLATLRSRREMNDRTFESFLNMLPIGQNPFELEVKYHSWAGFDDGDFNLHMSNSSYPKILDMARFKAALAFFPATFRSGGTMALGATHFVFLREIPLFSPYEVRISIGAWDSKWIYVVARYITSPGNPNIKSRINTNVRPEEALSISAQEISDASKLTSGTSTPQSPPNATPDTRNPTLALEQVSNELFRHPLALEEGAVLNCVSISQLVFKHGRITIPPALCIAMNGFSRPPVEASAEGLTQPFSRTCPPPHWSQAFSLLSLPKSAVSQFLRSGWREVPESARWWDCALGGDVEQKRKRNLDKIRGIREGMHNAMVLY